MCDTCTGCLALLKAQVSLQLGNVFSSDNGVSVSIMYSYMYWLLQQHTAKRIQFYLLTCMSALWIPNTCVHVSKDIMQIWALSRATDCSKNMALCVCVGVCVDWCMEKCPPRKVPSFWGAGKVPSYSWMIHHKIFYKHFNKHFGTLKAHLCDHKYPKKV